MAINQDAFCRREDLIEWDTVLRDQGLNFFTQLDDARLMEHGEPRARLMNQVFKLARREMLKIHL